MELTNLLYYKCKNSLTFFFVISLKRLHHSKTRARDRELSPQASCNNLQHSVGVFFNLTKNLRLIRCSYFSSHMVFGRRKKHVRFKPLLHKYYNSDKNVFSYVHRQDIQIPNTLLVFFPHPSKAPSRRAVSLFNSQTSYQFVFYIHLCCELEFCRKCNIQILKNDFDDSDSLRLEFSKNSILWRTFRSY